MRRREFVAGVGVAVALNAGTTRAQQSNQVRRLGVLMGLQEDDPEGERWVRALLDGLAQLGWKRDKDIKVDLRWGGTDLDRTQRLAKELIDLQPDVIETSATPATAAILRQTRTIPVVFSVVSDPVGSGFVESFVRPGGNATGFVDIEASLAGKWLDLLKEVAPGTSSASILFNPRTAPQSGYYLELLKADAASAGLALDIRPVEDAAQIEATIADLSRRANSGLVLLPDVFAASRTQRDLIISLTARHHIPTVAFNANFVRAGGLISYGVDFPDLQRRAAVYVDRILKGAKPSDLPVQLPTKFELAVNLKTAKALGLQLPPTLTAVADEVIE
jgi:putative ABC transport system substrate-binding protein